MQRDLLPDELDWVFCFRTAIGGVRGRARWSSLNGRPVPYQPHTVPPEQGLRFIVRGRTRACPLPPVGPRLDERGLLVPARDAHELDVLHDRAFALLHEGRATEWALAALAAGGQQRWGLYLSALEELVTELGRRIETP